MDATGVGRHAICEFWGASHLDSVERAEQALRSAASAGRVTLIALSNRFARAGLLWAAIATYPGAFWTFAIASKQLDPRVVRRHAEIDTRLYDVAAHEWFFIPEPVRYRLLAI